MLLQCLCLFVYLQLHQFYPNVSMRQEEEETLYPLSLSPKKKRQTEDHLHKYVALLSFALPPFLFSALLLALNIPPSTWICAFVHSPSWVNWCLVPFFLSLHMSSKLRPSFYCLSLQRHQYFWFPWTRVLLFRAMPLHHGYKVDV